MADGLRAVGAGGQGRYDSAYTDLATLLGAVPSDRLSSLAHSAQASFLRQLGWHSLARGWDGRAWAELGERERALLARDAHQVLGAGLDAPAACVVCWTPDGGIDGGDPRAEGTGQALRVAHQHGIAVYNLARAHGASARARRGDL